MSEELENSGESGLPARTYVLTPARDSIPYDQDSEIRIASYLTILLKHRWFILGMVLAGVSFALSMYWFQENRYRAQAKFLIAEKSSESIMGEGDVFVFRDPVSYYKEIALSTPILNRLLEEKFETTTGGEAVPLLNLLKIPGNTAEQRLHRGRGALQRTIEVTSQRTYPNLITLTVEASSPELAAALANRLIELLRHYDIDLKTSNVQDRIRFIETQLKETEVGLRAAERELQRFLQSNRITTAPHLTLARGRLERDLDLQNDLYKTLRRELEVTRIAEKKEASAISIIDPAVVPGSPSNPTPVFIAVIATSVAFLLSVMLAFIFEFFSSLSRSRGDSSELIRTWQETKQDFKRFSGLAKPLKRRSKGTAGRESTEFP